MDAPQAWLNSLNPYSGYLDTEMQIAHVTEMLTRTEALRRKYPDARERAERIVMDCRKACGG